VIVVAAGNEGSDAGGFSPAGLERVIAVASTDAADRRAAFSNWGAMIDVAAPGTDVLSLRARRTDLMHSIPGVEYESREAWVGDDQRYVRTSGTSFSAPIVAGVASAILSRRPDLTAEQVERMLLHTAQDIETPGFDQYTGYGLVDARAALAADPGFFVTARITGVKVVRVDGDPVVRVLGSTDADALERAWLAIGRGAEPNDWQRVSPDLTAPVRQGVLHDVPAESFRGSPVWMLRLITEHENGTRREARFRLNLGG
jgi:hypothetical protein